MEESSNAYDVPEFVGVKMEESCDLSVRLERRLEEPEEVTLRSGLEVVRGVRERVMVVELASMASPEYRYSEVSLEELETLAEAWPRRDELAREDCRDEGFFEAVVEVIEEVC